MTARLVGLFLRSRRAGVAIAWLAVMTAPAWWGFDLDRSPEVAGLLTTIVPLGAAIVIGASAGSPFGESERTASRSLPVLRLGHVGGLLVGGAVTLGAVGAVGPSEVGVWPMVRNGAGFAGLALLGARSLGAGTAWVPPTAYGLAVHAAADAGAAPAAWWLWPLRDPSDRLAWTAALGLVVAGLGAVACYGARDAVGTDAGACAAPAIPGDRPLPLRSTP